MKKQNKQKQDHPKSKIGKDKDDIFIKPTEKVNKEIIIPIANDNIEENKPTSGKITPTHEKPEIKIRGRPVEHAESWSKTTVVLLDRQIHWLDRLSSEIRLKTRKAISRAEIIRAMVAAVEESGLDLSNISTESEIKAFLLRQFNRPQ